MWCERPLSDAHPNRHALMRRCLFIAAFYGSALLVAAEAQEGPKNSVILIIRHAEDPANGHGLSARGEQRAEAYINYFQNFTLDSKRLGTQGAVGAAGVKET